MITFIEREHEEKITKRQLKRQSSSELTSEDGMVCSVICKILQKWVSPPQTYLYALLSM